MKFNIEVEKLINSTLGDRLPQCVGLASLS